jgi:hypothetical protein
LTANLFCAVSCFTSIKSRDALLTNWEVLQVVEEYLSSKRLSQHHINKTQEKSNIDTIAYEVHILRHL